MSRPRPLIIDISEHQLPSQINYQALAKSIDLAVVRVQFGSLRTDLHFQTHLRELKKVGVPVHVYAWVRGISNADMAQEAEDFYRLAKDYKPLFWWLDVEEASMPDLPQGCEQFRQRLKTLGAKKVGIYVANHLFQQFGFNEPIIKKYDALWLPTYGANTGEYQGANPTAATYYDWHQYTSNSRLAGYNGPLDVSRHTGRQPFSFFSGTESPIKPGPYQVGNRVQITGIYTSSMSDKRLSPLRNQGVITRIIPGTRNPYLLDEGGLGWVNDDVIVSKVSTRIYQVKSGDTLWGIGQKLGLAWQTLASLNDLLNPDMIYPGQLLRY